MLTKRTAANGSKKDTSLLGGFADLFTSIGTSASAVVGSWAGIKQKQADIKLLNQKVKINNQIIKANQIANQPQVIVAAAPSGFISSFRSIPPWVLAAGAIAAVFALRGVIK